MSDEGHEGKLKEKEEQEKKMNKFLQSKNQIYRICFTGGPCAGKTTAITKISQSLNQKGFKVFIVPQAATLLGKSGAFIATPKMGIVDAVKFQIQVLRLQMSLQDIFTEIAINSDCPVIILTDRGVMDGSAYCKKDVWQALLDQTGWNTVQLRDRRYEAVFHMVTAADGAEEYYSNNTNSTRYQTVEEAIRVDKNIMEAWVGHPHFMQYIYCELFDYEQLRIIDNLSVKSFNEKIVKSHELLLKFIGIPSTTTFQKKLIVHFDELPEKIRFQTFTVQQTYLQPYGPADEFKIRKRGQADAYTYQTHLRQVAKNGQRIQTKRQITARQYMQLMERKLQNRRTIIKKRCCFLWEQQSFILDTLINIEGSPSILRVQTLQDTKQVNIPYFFKVIEDCTDSPLWSTNAMSKIGWSLPQVKNDA